MRFVPTCSKENFWPAERICVYWCLIHKPSTKLIYVNVLSDDFCSFVLQL